LLLFSINNIVKYVESVTELNVTTRRALQAMLMYNEYTGTGRLSRPSTTVSQFLYDITAIRSFLRSMPRFRDDSRTFPLVPSMLGWVVCYSGRRKACEMRVARSTEWRGQLAESSNGATV